MQETAQHIAARRSATELRNSRLSAGYGARRCRRSEAHAERTGADGSPGGFALQRDHRVENILNHGQSASVQKYRSRLFYQALASASVIISYRADNPFLKRRERESVTRATVGTKKKSQQRQEVLAELIGPPPRLATKQIVYCIEEAYTDKLKALGQDAQEHDTIRRLVNKYRKNARSFG